MSINVLCKQSKNLTKLIIFSTNHIQIGFLDS